MTNEQTAATPRFSAGSAVRLVFACLLGAGGIALRMSGFEMAPLVSLAAFGGAVLSAAFLLAWAAEALQVDISQGMAMAVLAFIAVLPEYAVDLYFAASAAKDPSYAQYAAANMTGSNRLLIGIGWSVVALCSLVYSVRKKHAESLSTAGVTLAPGYGVDLTVLGLATAWALLMPLTRHIAVWNGIGLLVLFGFYIWRVSGAAESEPELAGVAKSLGDLPKRPRHAMVAFLLILASGTLLAAAKPFAEALIHSGEVLHINRFLLVQWLAPLASEAPELLVATIFATRGHGSAGISALLSSKVNQWTLLVGTLPIVYSAALGRVGALPLDDLQTEELVLTAAQSLLGVTMLLNGRLTLWKALTLLILFLIQLPFTQQSVRYGMSALYGVLGLFFLVRYARYAGQHLRLTFDFSKPEPPATESLGADHKGA